MTGNDLPPYKLRPAKRGSKAGWVNVSGQVPPEVGEKFLSLIQGRDQQQTDAVCDAITQYVEREAA